MVLLLGVVEVIETRREFSREVLKFVKFNSQKTGGFGYGRRIMFLLPNV